MKAVKCTNLRMEGSFFILTADASNGYAIYSLKLDSTDLQCLSIAELREVLNEIESEIFAMKSASSSLISAISAMEEDWRESDDTPENGDGSGQDA